MRNFTSKASATFALSALFLIGIATTPASAAIVGDTTAVFLSEDPEFSAVSPDGTAIIHTAYYTEQAYLIETATGEVSVVEDADALLNGPAGVVYSPDGETAYIANYFGHNVVVVDVLSASVTGTIEAAEFTGPWALGIAPDGETLLVGDYDDAVLHLYDLVNDTVTNSVALSANALYDIHVASDGSVAYTVDDSGLIDVIDLDSAAIVDTFDPLTNARIYSTCVNSDMTTVFVPDHRASRLYAISLTDGSVIASNIATEGTGNGSNYDCVVSPDGSTVYVTNSGIGGVAVDDYTIVTEAGVVSAYDATTLDFIADYVFDGVAYTQQMNFYDDCNAYVVGFSGNAQAFDDCATEESASLASTGVELGTGSGWAFGALAAGIALIGVRRFSRR